MANKNLIRSMVLAQLCAALVIAAPWAEAKDGNGRSKVKPRAVRGLITALSPSSVTVGDSTFAITSRSLFQDFLENPTVIDAFQVGDCVKVKPAPSTTVPTVREMELEDHCAVVPPTSATPKPRQSDDRRKPAASPTATPTPATTPSATPSAVPTPDDDSSDDEAGDDNGHHHRGRGGHHS